MIFFYIWLIYSSKGAWHIFNGNEIGALLGWWQLQNYLDRNGPDVDKSKLFYIASTVSSKLLRSIAKKEGLSFEVSN
jgi:phosphomannomutase